MKKILFVLFVFISLVSIAQDSSKIRVSGIILKGRESDIVADVVRANTGIFPILDSVLKVIYVVKPANGDNVTFNSIPNKEWVKMLRLIRNDALLVVNNAFKNVRDELILHGSVFINHRINLDDIRSNDEFTERKKSGQKYAQKEDDNENL